MLVVRIATELIGTFVFVAVILTTGDPIAIAAALLTAIYFGGKLSGGHFNPAVSTAMLMRGAIGARTYASYVVAQLVGAALAVVWWKSAATTRRELGTGAKLE